MSGLLARRAIASFPEWQKSGWDIGSNTAMLMRLLIDPIEAERANVVMEHKDQFLFKNWLEKGDIYTIQLDSGDNYTKSLGSWSTKTVHGDGQELTEVANVAALLGGPDRYLVSERVDASFDFTLYGHAPLEITAEDTGYENEVYQVEETILFPNHLTLEITGGRFFRQRENVQVSGVASFEIFGRDINGFPISEVLEVNYYSTWQTKHIYSYVERIVGDETRSLQWTLRLGRNPDLYQKHPFLTAHTRGSESILYLKVYSEENRSIFSFNVRNEFLPEEEELNPEKSYTEISSTVLMSGEIDIEVADWFIHPQNGFVYVQATDGYVLVYDLSLPEFTTCSLNEALTYNSFISLRPEKGFARLDESMGIVAHLLDPMDGINKVFIYRKSPAGVLNFLQPDKTWSGVEAHFSFDRRSYQDWQDIKFETVLSEYGQWEFYVQCTVDKETTLSATSIIVDYKLPISTFASEASNMILLRGHKLLFIQGNYAYECTARKMSYLADKENGRIYLVDNFSSVEVS